MYSIYEDDEITIKSLNEKVIKIDNQASDDYVAKACEVGVAQISIASLYTEDVIIIEITVEAKEGVAPPIESMELSIKESGPYYVGKTYHLEYKIYSSIYNDTFRFITNDDYDINQETAEIVFKHAGTFIVSIFAQGKSVRTNISVEVSFDPNEEMYEVLYIGNSLTYVHDIPSIIANMITADGAYISYCQDTPGGSYLKDHKDNFNTLINKYDFTHVILQGQSYEAIGSYSGFLEAILYYDEIIKQKGAKTILYQTWAYNRYIYNGRTKDQMTQALVVAYDNAANQINAKVTRFGEAFKLFESIVGLEPSLYQDMNHQSLYGAYLSACVHYSTLTGRRASYNTYVIEGIDEEMMHTIQNIADKISFAE